MDKLITLEAEIVADTKLMVEGAAEVEIDASESITLEIAPDTYVLGSVGSFNTASSWVGTYVNELVRESIGTGGTLKDALDLIRTDVMDSIELGVNQVISQVENEFVSNSTLATTLGSELGSVRSSILDVKNTYATKDQAQAYSVNAIKASFGGNSSSSAIEAYIGNIAVTKVDADSATAATVTTLIASMNDQSVRIDEMDSVLVTTTGWAASASKLITAPDGSITGWEFADGSDSESTFKIKAQNFEISNGVNGYTPFSISGNNINFNGMVAFSNITGGESILTTGEAAADINANTTTINGGKITTGSITAGQINVGSVQAATVTASYINALNIVADSVDAGWVYAGNINAGNITAGTLNVDVINSGDLVTAKGPVTVSFSKSGSSSGTTTLATIKASNISGSLNMLVINFEAYHRTVSGYVDEFARVMIAQDGVVKLIRNIPGGSIGVYTSLDFPYITAGNNSVFTVIAAYDLGSSETGADYLTATGSVSLVEFKK